MRWVARYGRSRSSAPVRLIAEEPAGARRRRHALAHLPCPLGKGAEVRATHEHPFGFGEDRASGGGLAQCEMGVYEREKSQMYIQRYLPHFPAAGEVVIFDRSWYNRAGVEAVMGFCTPGQGPAGRGLPGSRDVGATSTACG